MTPDIRPGAIIDGYEILDLLGQGGMGAVYRARKNQVDYALKTILGSHLDLDALQRFEREALSLAKVSKHPHIVTIHHYRRRQADAYMVLDFVDGQDLAEAIRGGLRLDSQSGSRSSADDDRSPIIDLAQKMAMALQHLHDHGLLHRDFKPANVLLRKHDQCPLLTDFGLIKNQDFQTLTRTGDLLGTPAFLAPELIQGQAASVETDIWAFAVTLYQLLSGGPVPFPGANAVETCQRILRFEPTPLSRHRASSPALDQFFDKAFDKDSTQRWPTLSALLGAFEDALRSASAPARASKTPYLLVIGLLLLALLGGVYGLLQNHKQQALERQLTALEDDFAKQRPKLQAQAMAQLLEFSYPGCSELAQPAFDIRAFGLAVRALKLPTDSSLRTRQGLLYESAAQLGVIGLSKAPKNPKLRQLFEAVEALREQQWELAERRFVQLLKRRDLSDWLRTLCQTGRKLARTRPQHVLSDPAFFDKHWPPKQVTRLKQRLAYERSLYSLFLLDGHCQSCRACLTQPPLACRQGFDLSLAWLAQHPQHRPWLEAFSRALAQLQEQSSERQFTGWFMSFVTRLHEAQHRHALKLFQPRLLPVLKDLHAKLETKAARALTAEDFARLVFADFALSSWQGSTKGARFKSSALVAHAFPPAPPGQTRSRLQLNRGVMQLINIGLGHNHGKRHENLKMAVRILVSLSRFGRIPDYMPASIFTEGMRSGLFDGVLPKASKDPMENFWRAYLSSPPLTYSRFSRQVTATNDWIEHSARKLEGPTKVVTQDAFRRYQALIKARSLPGEYAFLVRVEACRLARILAHNGLLPVDKARQSGLRWLGQIDAMIEAKDLINPDPAQYYDERFRVEIMGIKGPQLKAHLSRCLSFSRKLRQALVDQEPRDDDHPEAVAHLDKHLNKRATQASYVNMMSLCHEALEFQLAHEQALAFTKFVQRDPIYMSFALFQGWFLLLRQWRQPGPLKQARKIWQELKAKGTASNFFKRPEIQSLDQQLKAIKLD